MTSTLLKRKGRPNWANSVSRRLHSGLRSVAIAAAGYHVKGPILIIQDVSLNRNMTDDQTADFSVTKASLMAKSPEKWSNKDKAGKQQVQEQLNICDKCVNNQQQAWSRDASPRLETFL